MNKRFSRLHWLPLLLTVALVFPGVQLVRASTSPDDTDPTVFGDGIYKKFGLDLGFAGRTKRFSVYTYGSGTALDVSNVSLVTGDVALAGASSNLNVHDYALVYGDQYIQTSSTETTNNYGYIVGTKVSNTSTNTLLNGGFTSLKNVSNLAAGLTKTTGSPSTINMNGGSTTFNNNPFSGKYVMQLTNLTLTNNATLTLNGAAGSAFVINVSHDFSLTNHSRINLTGGLTPADVLFNVTGASGLLQITGSSLLEGTLLAYNKTSSTQRTVTVSDDLSMVKGEILASKVIVKCGSWVKKPHKESHGHDGDFDECDREHEREHEHERDHE